MNRINLSSSLRRMTSGSGNNTATSSSSNSANNNKNNNNSNSSSKGNVIFESTSSSSSSTVLVDFPTPSAPEYDRYARSSSSIVVQDDFYNATDQTKEHATYQDHYNQQEPFTSFERISNNIHRRRATSAVDAARHICEEARLVLSSLRSGPPSIAHGELSQDLQNLRKIVKADFFWMQQQQSGEENVKNTATQRQHKNQHQMKSSLLNEQYQQHQHQNLEQDSNHSRVVSNDTDDEDDVNPPEEGWVGVDEPTPSLSSSASSSLLADNENTMIRDASALKRGETGDSIITATTRAAIILREKVQDQQQPYPPVLKRNLDDYDEEDLAEAAAVDVGPYALPFLNVILDPQAAGPHTMVAIRALHRLLDRGSLLCNYSPLESTMMAKATSVSPMPTNTESSGSEQSETYAPPQQHQFVFATHLEPLTTGVLNCRFELTNAGADEAVEMALADLLSLLVKTDASLRIHHIRTVAAAVALEQKIATSTDFSRDITAATLLRSLSTLMDASTRMDAFHTVFINRNSYVHSPALCYHFESVLTEMVTCAFQILRAAQQFPSSLLEKTTDDNTICNFLKEVQRGACVLLDFLVQQLLHTPLLLQPLATTTTPSSVMTSGSSSSFAMAGISNEMGGGIGTAGTGPSGGPNEAQALHDATRILCLNLTRCALRAGWDPAPLSLSSSYHDIKNSEGRNDVQNTEKQTQQQDEGEERSVLSIIKDELCLSLLLTGQAIITTSHHHHHPSSHADPMSNVGFHNSQSSLEILSGVCSTISTLYNIQSLRKELTRQFETIFTGFFERSLVLLRTRPIPKDSASFVSNLAFDSKCEIVLETLVDLLCIGKSGSRMTREVSLLSSNKHVFGKNNDIDDNTNDNVDDEYFSPMENLYLTYDCDIQSADVVAGMVVELCRCCGGDDAVVATLAQNGNDAEQQQREVLSPQPSSAKRKVPAYLRELCNDALSGTIKQLSPTTITCQVETIDNEADKGALDLNDDENVHAKLSLKETEGGQILQKPRERSQLRLTKHFKRLTRQGAMKFNKSSTSGIIFLAEVGILPSSANSPLTPQSVASFLKRGVVVGLDKVAIGSYLGEVGKSPRAGKNPHDCERDYFHAAVLLEYCQLFHFHNQSLLDGLRMFLSSFRLPGEAQQIDRILQAFAESSSQQCNEAVKHNLFSNDAKKAADGAYLLAFSIIMLNTDLHNPNIRLDRKMTCEAFVKNNANYGRDITDEGKDFPREFLESIYGSIRGEEIRTEGEGADGVMTLERWKDVLLRDKNCDDHDSRNDSSSPIDVNNAISAQSTPRRHLHDVKHLVLETIWLPVLGAVSGFLGVQSSTSQYQQPSNDDFLSGTNNPQTIATEGARLGLDLAIELLSGVRIMSRKDLFQTIFVHICQFSGLIGNNAAASRAGKGNEYYQLSTEIRVQSLTNSIQRQSSIIVAINGAQENGDFVGPLGWNSLWYIIFELRDLKLLGRKGGGLLIESDIDLLNKDSRLDRTASLIKERLRIQQLQAADTVGGSGSSSSRGLFSSMGKFLWGEEEELSEVDSHGEFSSDEDGGNIALPGGNGGILTMTPPSLHEKEQHLIWNDLAPSDDEEVDDNQCSSNNNLNFSMGFDEYSGDADNVNDVMRCKVRRKLASVCDFHGLCVTESQYLQTKGLRDSLSALMGIVQNNSTCISNYNRSLTRSNDDPSNHNSSRIAAKQRIYPLSPASEALAEVLICEITLKNKDRIQSILDLLTHHYQTRLGIFVQQDASGNNASESSSAAATSTMHNSGKQYNKSIVGPGMEKCITGLLRLCFWTMVSTDTDTKNLVLSLLSFLCPPRNDDNTNLLYHHPSNTLDKHISEGLWRICRNIKQLHDLTTQSWSTILSLTTHCALRGGNVIRSGPGRGGLAEDDPALQAFRILHLLLHSRGEGEQQQQQQAPLIISILKGNFVGAVRGLVRGGEKGSCEKLCTAGLDLYWVLHGRLQDENIMLKNGNGDADIWIQNWKLVLEGMAEAAEKSVFGSVRQHALSMFIDAVVDTRHVVTPPHILFDIIKSICVPVAGSKISQLLQTTKHFDDLKGRWEEIMIELELCVSLVFKPFLHHLTVLNNQNRKNGGDVNLNIDNDQREPEQKGLLCSLWMAMLDVMKQLLGNEATVLETEYQSRRRRIPSSARDNNTDDKQCGPSPPVSLHHYDHTNSPNKNAMTRETLLLTTKELSCEHLRNAVMVLMGCGVLKCNSSIISNDKSVSTSSPNDDDDDDDELSAMTWNVISEMKFCSSMMEEWQLSGLKMKEEHEQHQQQQQGQQELVNGEEREIRPGIMIAAATMKDDNSHTEVGENTCESITWPITKLAS
mmetsp:Transcript_33251/g.38489  ORF Transcript_33251/g.38489 Transcript_33251/m.38489 type:complete len:2324 (+) Transcript_33251:190-7161(+)